MGSMGTIQRWYEYWQVTLVTYDGLAGAYEEVDDGGGQFQLYQLTLLGSQCR